MASMKQRMLDGDLYIADDPELANDHARAQALLERFNATAACQIATRVQLLTATHPIDPVARRDGWEYARPITMPLPQRERR